MAHYLKDLTKIIKFIGRKNILNAKDFINNYKNNTLKNDNVYASHLMME